MFAADSDETVPRRPLPRSLEDKFNVIPVVERVLDLSCAFGISDPHRLHHGIGEHDAPAERIVGLIALDNGHNVFRMPTLHEKAEIEPGRAAADTYYPHDPSAFSRPVPNSEKLLQA
jgi:hypothetical protein